MFGVLVVDDDAQHLRFLAHGLRLLPGVAVATCTSMPEALRIARKAPPNLLLTVRAIGDQSALEVVQQLSEILPSLPEVVFMTDPRDAPTGDVHGSVDAGILIRPVHLAELREVMQRAMEREQRPIGRHVNRSMLRTLDLVRLAMLSGDSARISIDFEGRHVGDLVVRDHGVWSACDPLGGGEAAFCRLLQRPGRATCTLLTDEECGERNMDSLFFDAETGAVGSTLDRIFGQGSLDAPEEDDPPAEDDPPVEDAGDDRNLADAAADTVTPELPSHDGAEAAADPHAVDPDAVDPNAAEPDAVDPNAERDRDEVLDEPTPAPAPEATATARLSELDRAERFEAALDQGVDALLRKAYDEAVTALQLADSLRPGHPIVAANLGRLRDLGHVPS